MNLLIPFLILVSLWLTPGLVGLLNLLGLNVLAGFATVVIHMTIVTMILVAFIGAKGTYKFREHAFDMAPWAVIVIALSFIASR